jgi:hypothetical protein
VWPRESAPISGGHTLFGAHKPASEMPPRSRRGGIVERGTHGTLLASEGAYARRGPIAPDEQRTVATAMAAGVSPCAIGKFSRRKGRPCPELRPSAGARGARFLLNRGRPTKQRKELIVKSIGLLFLGAVAACASTPSPNVLVQTQSSPDTSFAGYRTFGFRHAEAPPAPFEVSARSFEVERRVRALVVAQLVSKGYMEQTAPANPDFFVTLSAGYADDPPFGGEAPLFETDEKGAFVIDVFDASSAAHVWHGTAEAEVDPRQINDQLLQVGVRRALSSFPARGPEDRPTVASKQPF